MGFDLDCVQIYCPYLAMTETSDTQDLAKLVIGVVTFNNSNKQIRQLMRSIELSIEHLDGRYIEAEIYIIDNGEKSGWPGTTVKLRRFESVGNVGFGKAMNILMAAAFAAPAANWFLCVNPDGALHYKALAELLARAEAFPASLIEARQFPEEHPKEYNPTTLDTPWASGACLLIPEKIHQTIGGFDPNFFMYLEDIDYSWRARAAGFSIKFAPNALFGHDVLKRQDNPKAHHYFLLSSRYLGVKWRNMNYVRRIERELINFSLFTSRAELPPVPRPDFEMGELDLSIADFGHGFYYAPARW